MKKFLSMFAFVAVFVIGAIALASCGDDDKVIEPTHKYGFKVELKTNKTAEVEFMQEVGKIITEEVSKFVVNNDMTALEGSIFWQRLSNDSQFLEAIYKILDKAAEEIDDQYLACTVTWLKDGQPVPFCSKTVYTKYTGKKKTEE